MVKLVGCLLIQVFQYPSTVQRLLDTLPRMERMPAELQEQVIFTNEAWGRECDTWGVLGDLNPVCVQGRHLENVMSQ